MKKALLFVMIMLSLLSFNTGRAQATGLITYGGGLFIVGKGTVFVFNGSGFRNRDLRQATIFVGSNYHKLSCSVNRGDAKIVCVIRGGISDEYAGETGIIYLAGQVFYVTIPGRPLKCGGLDALGADVEFEDSEGTFYTEFVPGQNLDAVEATAASSVVENELGGYRVLGTLYCAEVIEEEIVEDEVPGEEVPGEGGPDEPIVLVGQVL